MEFIEAGQIEIEPFILDAVLELHLKEALSEHAAFYLLARLEKDQGDKPLDSIKDKTQIKFKNNGKIIFSGVIKNIDITCIDEVFYLRLFAVSNTALIDVAKKSRSFQDAAKKYNEIVGEITSGAKSSVDFGDTNAADKTVENIILQYEETDWAFAKRLASHSNAVLIPVINTESPDFIFGLKDAAPKEKLDIFNYSVNKNLSAFRTMSQFEALGFTEDDAVSYSITVQDYIFNLGDKLSLDEGALYISSVNLKLKGSVLDCTYTLSTKNALSAKRIFNAVTGLALSGTVLKAIDDTVKVHLNIDDKQDEGTAYQFKYATPYSAESHTGWYVMPEEGDTIQVVFPNEDERYAYAATSAAKSYVEQFDDYDKSGNAAGSVLAITETEATDTEKVKNPRAKFLRTPDGKEIKLDEKEIVITAKDDNGKDEITFIRINEDSGISIITPHPVVVTSNSTISMTSDDDFSITTHKNLIITADESILMSAKDNNSSISMENTAPGIIINTKDPIGISGDKTIDMKSKNEFTVDAGKDLSAGSDKKIILSGGSAIEASSNGSSIKMDGNIDMKAKLIKEN